MSNHPIRLMIDFETPSTSTTTAPLTFGATQFAVFDDTTNILKPFPKVEFYKKASLASIERRGFTVSKETMEWWNKQDPEMRAEVFSGTQDIESLIDEFIRWCEWNFTPEALKDIELWSRGAGFDCEILQHVCMELWGNYPFDFRKHNCQRTVANTLPARYLDNIPSQVHKHHALHDARYQACVIELTMATVKQYIPDAYTITA